MFSAPSSTRSCLHLPPLKLGWCLLLASGGLLSGAEPPAFTPPQAYPAARYEAGWSKNPFTLKTVAAVAAQGSFARDLAIGAHYGAVDNPTVVIVNTKTNERTLLRKDQPAPGGMRLKSAHLTSHRSECQVEVVQGAEDAVLTYDAGYLSQLAAGEAARMAASKAPSSSPPKRPHLPTPTAARGSSASPVFKVSNLEPPLPMPPAAPLQNRPPPPP
ncbi:MAG: hypothetical protein J0L73_26995 [Verrucomicrobia bacterium]|nr:hypothetical protein [Verrucomicrobiota bacterium]